MKEKTKKILFAIIELGVVVWAINGIMSNYYTFSWSLAGDSDKYHIAPVLAYFLSAVLILYLLRKYERKN